MVSYHTVTVIIELTLPPRVTGIQRYTCFLEIFFLTPLGLYGTVQHGTDRNGRSIKASYRGTYNGYLEYAKISSGIQHRVRGAPLHPVPPFFRCGACLVRSNKLKNVTD